MPQRNTPLSPGPHGLRRKKGPKPGIQRSEILLLLGVGFFVVALVGGYAWALDRQLRGGLLRQHAEASSRPDWVSLQTLPAYVPAAFLTVVDPDLQEREGFAIEADRATLSRDLVRQVHLLSGTLDGRAREIVMAPLLEHRLPSRQLLELYLNRVYLGREDEWPIFGILHAAREYFHKEPNELTLSEAATLAGLLLPPRIESPHDRPGAVGVRRHEVLREMRRTDRITVQDYEAALAEPLGFQPGISAPPMTRPARWQPETRVIRLPPELRPQADTVPEAPAT
jgi:membrane peptidoglycan carboxypeptidase